MKVYLLWYYHYDESNVLGVYTVEGKKKKEKELLEEALKYCKEVQEVFEKEVLRHREMRAKNRIELNEMIEFCKEFPHSKELHKRKKQLIKKDEELLRSIKRCQLDAEKYSPEFALQRYMHNEHFYWEEREVIE